MQLVGIAILLVGSALPGAVSAIATALHRRYALPYALLTVGIITYSGAWFARVALLQVWDRALLGILPVGALLTGITVGFTEEIARLLGFQVLARSTVTRPQALMIGLGHALPWAIYTALIVTGTGLSMIGGAPDEPDDLTVMLSDALAGSLNALLPVIMHMALSWLVLQVFLRGELYWLFVAIFLHTTVAIMARLLGSSESWAVAGWYALVALLSLGPIFRLRGPAGELYASPESER